MRKACFKKKSSLLQLPLLRFCICNIRTNSFSLFPFSFFFPPFFFFFALRSTVYRQVCGCSGQTMSLPKPTRKILLHIAFKKTLKTKKPTRVIHNLFTHDMHISVSYFAMTFCNKPISSQFMCTSASPITILLQVS